MDMERVPAAGGAARLQALLSSALVVPKDPPQLKRSRGERSKSDGKWRQQQQQRRELRPGGQREPERRGRPGVGQSGPPALPTARPGVGMAAEGDAGPCTFGDILRRAAKNEDGKRSLDEFRAYFADGVLSGEELRELFHAIDTRANELGFLLLLDYFSQHLGEYGNVLCLEDLNITILKAMNKTKKGDPALSGLGRIRGSPGEPLSRGQQLCNPENPTGSPENTGKHKIRKHKKENTPIYIHKGSWTEEDNQWITQIKRLQKLIDRLETKHLQLEPFEEVLEENARSLYPLIPSVSVQELSNDSRFIVCEFWETISAWNRSHLQMNYSKTFQRNNVDFLETLELMTTMLVPASWWVLNSN
ncbi:LOW QUALITY PROTEIN: N-terminal EF-hand calcium-binding protein 1 [Eudromia elegans]